jgi:predicted RNase H-like nuclease (RuvC/YqgF family)
MGTVHDKIINTFATRVRQMLLQHNALKKENVSLRKEVMKRDAEIADLKAELELWQAEYDNLKLTKMLEITDGDMETAQKRVAKLIRDVNKCITMLSEK